MGGGGEILMNQSLPVVVVDAFCCWYLFVFCCCCFVLFFGGVGGGQRDRCYGSPRVMLEALEDGASTQKTPLPVWIILLHGLVGHPPFIVTGCACRKPNTDYRAVTLHPLRQ